MRELELRLVRRFLRDHPADAARALEGVSAEERADLLGDEPPESAAEILRLLLPAAAAEALQAMEIRSAVALLARMPPGQAAQKVRRLSWATQDALLRAVPAPWHKPLERALATPAFTAGALMQRHPPALAEDLTAPEALAEVERRPGQLAFDVFVIERHSGRLTGRTDLAELHKASPARTLSGLMHPRPASISADALAVGLPRDPLWLRHETLPVTDALGLLVGSLSHRALRALLGEGDRPSGLASPVVEATELVWSGYMAALDVATTLLRRPQPAPEKSLEAEEALDGA
ncbi:MAG: hypothetical protein GC160_13335 [Acidobacteria bacterium]|nr:hypothetical protein [Acidobacteriota bacterium]